METKTEIKCLEALIDNNINAIQNTLVMLSEHFPEMGPKCVEIYEAWKKHGQEIEKELLESRKNG